MKRLWWVVSIYMLLTVPSAHIAWSEPFAFVVISDPRPKDHYSGVEQDMLQIKDWVDNPTADMPAPVFVENTGDFDHTRQMEAIMDSALGTDFVWFPTVGNHEIDALYDFECVRDTLVPALPWIVDSGPTGSVNTSYSWDYGDGHFVAANCYWDGNPSAGHDYVTDGNAPQELRDWIEADLISTSKPHKFVFIHEPPYPEVRHVGDSLDKYPANRDSLVVMLDRNGVEALFVGHDHYYHHDVSSEHPLLGDVHQVDSGQLQGPGSGGDGSTIIYVKVDGDTATYKAYRSTTGMPFSLHEEWNIVTDGNYILDVTVLGSGSVALDPPGGSYPESTAVALTATPDSGYSFSGWSGDLTGSANPDTIIMDDHKAVTATFVGSTAVCEDFESGYTLGQELRTHADWFYEDGNSGPVPTAGIGVDGSIGLSNGDRAFTWVAHEFNWNDPLLMGVWFQMDYQTDASGVFDDDRLGWTISDTDDNSDWIFGVQMDPGGGGAGGNIETYWDGDTFGDDGGRYSIVDLPALSGDTWYRLRGEFTKLTATSARIDVALWLLNASGDTVSKVVSGSIADTDLLPGGAGEELPNDAYFTATSMWPVYKNYDGAEGAADNTCFGIIASEQEQYTLSLTIVGNANVTLDPPGDTYDAGTVVTLTAVPESAWVFTGWSGDLTGDDNPDSLTMDSNKSVTATFVPQPTGTTICEDFESGFTLGQTIGNHSEWFDDGNGPVVNSNLGVNGSVGLAPATAIFIWTAHPFDWTDPDFQSYHVRLDFQTDGSGHLDDDRVGWMITDDDVGSSNIFGVQCDPGGGGYNIEGYWDGVSSADRRPSIVDLPTLSNNSWYQLRADIAKLTATSASIDVALIELDSSGDSVSVVASGSIPNTAALGDDAPNSKYFTTTAIWPAFKNYTSAGANADNACFQVLSTPETYTLAVNTVGNGSVDLDPPGGTYDSGTEVELTADADSGWVFGGWSDSLSGCANPDTITMTGDMTVTATFVQTVTGIHTESFESGFTLGADVGEHADWFDGDDDEGSDVTAGIGLLGSIGLGPGSRVFTWTAHPFSWNAPDFQQVNLQMDFQTDASGQFDDDRLTWNTAGDDYASENLLGVQLDHSDGGIVTYWRDSTDTRIQTQIVDISGLSADTWYRFRAEITKLAATEAQIGVSLVELDGSGNPTGTPYTGTVTNTSTWPDGAPDLKYFTACAMWGAFKNYQAVDGACDNAHLEVLYGPMVQDTLTVNIVGNGSVDLFPPGNIYNTGTDVLLTAVPDSGWIFDEWSGDLTGSDNPDTLTMSGNKTVTATFVEGPQCTLTVATAGGGSVTLDPPGGVYDWDTKVQLTAVPDSGWFFNGWSGDLTGLTNPDTVTMIGNLSVTATFDSLAATVVCEDFESGYTPGTELRTHPDWFYESGNSGPIVTSGIGVDGSIGLSNGDRAFTWVAHEFTWSDPDLVGVWFQMDYQTDASGTFDDDRLGWTISNTDDSSDWIFGVQMDPGGSGAGGNIETYWDGDTFGDDGGRFSIVDLPALSGSTWYRLKGEFTKLTATSARIDVTLWELDAAGDTIGQVVSGGVPDTDLLPGGEGEELPNPGYFTATSMWPVYKNYDGTEGAADNTCFGIITGPPGQDTLTVSVSGSGSVELDPPGGVYPTGTDVELTAEPDPGWLFSAWSGDLFGNANPDTITMSGNMDVTATFVEEGELGPGDVIISGMQAWNSVGDQDPAEFVELFNTTAQTISLENMELISRTDNNSDGALEIDWQLSASLTGKSIAPYSFFLIAESGVTAEGGVQDVQTDMDLATGEGGVAERAISLELVIDGVHMDYVLYGRDDGQNPVGEMPPGDIAFDSTGSWPRPEVCRNTLGTDSFQEGLLRRESADDLYAGYAVNGYYTDEGSLGQGYPAGVWYSPHDNTDDGYVARSSASDPVTPQPNNPPQVSLVSPPDDDFDVSLDPELRVNVTDSDDDTMSVTFYGREKSAGGNFTLIPIPDTQKYSLNYPWIYYDQMQWIVDSMAVWNIVFAAHEGDIVDTYGSTLEWMRADTAMSILEDPISTGLPEGIPYSVVPGNHDTPTTNYNTYFGVSRFAGRSYYGGHDGSDNDNNYSFFSAGGMDFIVIGLEYNPSSSYIAWADSLLAAYPNRRGIVVTHYILNTNGSWGGQGQLIYDTLKDNPNLDLMLCGHMHGEALRTEVYNGDTTYVILADYQDITNGGNGWLRIMEFQPAQNRVRVLTYSPYIDQYGTDTSMGDDTISEEFFLSYDMSTKGAFSLIGTVDDIASGSDAFLSWPGRAPGTEYEWYVKAFDGIDTTTSDIWTFTTIDTVPQCTLSVSTVGSGQVQTSPPGTVHNCGSNVVLTAVPDSAWQFDSWSGDLTGSQNPDTLTLSGNMTVTAYFEEIPWIGWVEKYPDPHPTARAYAAMACLDGGQAVLFGGWDGSDILADTWVYDIAESTWTQMSPASSPSARAGHAMAHIGGDRAMLFGGDVGSYSDETWIYDLSEDSWTQMSPAASPSPRADFDLAFLGGDQVLLFGGNTGSDNDETWVYDLSEDAWTQKSPATKPSARSEHGMAYLGGDQALLFGGNNGTLNDQTYVYDLSANTWTQMSPAAKPSARATFTMAYFGGDQVVLFGGDASGYNDETWIYDLGENAWTEQVGTPHPSARYAYAMSESRMDGSRRIVLFGGYHGTMSDETWLFGREDQEELHPPQAVEDLRALQAFGTSGPGSKDIRLIWSAVTADTTGAPLTVDAYVVYRDTLLGFVPGPATELGTTADTTYLDAGACGDAGHTYFYFVNARKDTLESMHSQCIGEFDQDLINGEKQSIRD
jgi:hypothetical protein